MSQKGVPAENAGNTSGLFSNAVVGQAVDDHRPSWLQRIFKSRKCVDSETDLIEQKEGDIGKKKLRKFSAKRNTTGVKGDRLLG